MNTKFLFIFGLLFSLQILHAQVGIGTTNPKSSLDITSSNLTNPANTDGLLIPKIDNFPSVNPGADQDGMMVYVTGNGVPAKGFYYWDNDTTSWISVRGSDSDFYEIGTTTPPDAIIDDIYTLGKLKIGQNSPANASLSVHDWNSSNFSAVNISRSLNTPSTSGQFNGFYTSLDAQTSDNYFGVQSILSGNIQSQSANYYALASGSLDGFTNLFSGSFYSASGTGRLYGVHVGFMSTVTNTGNKYGFNVDIPSSLPGTHYGLYSNVQNSSGYAAYLIGRTSLGHTTANRYIMPSADGSTGQVMTTDGFGNISFETPVSGPERINDLLDAKSDNDGSDDGSSLFLGIDAGANDDSTHNYNVGIGFQALQSNISSWGNTAIGHQAMQANTSGMNNTATGAFSLTNNNSGVDNAAFGNAALGTNTVGSFNSAIGYASLNSNTNGNYNTALGYWTLLNNVSGSRNVTLGSSSGYTNTNGSDNVFIGYQSGYFETGSEKLYIENSNGDSNNALIYGEFDTNILRTNGEFQIGNPSTTGYVFPTSDGTNGQVMTTDGSGNITFQNVVGDGTGTDNQNLTTATLTGTTLNLGIQNGTGTSVNLASLTDDNDWVTVGANIERQSGNVYIGNTNLTNNDIYISNNIIDWDNTNYYLNPDDTSVVDEIQFDNGTAADPSIRFQDINTGFFSPSNAITAYSANGTESFRIQNDGEISIGLTAPSDYKFSLSSLSNLNEIRIGNNTTSTNDFIDINHNSQRGNAIDISVDNSYTLASRSGIAVFNELGDTSVNIGKYLTGSYNIYGVEVRIPEDLSGIEYGIYSNVSTTNGYAGYFIGRMSLGNSTVNRYIMPAADGTNGQVMTTDGSGNVTFQNPTTNTDDQQIDNFSFNASTNILTLEMEADGQAPQTVDLSSLNPSKSLARITMSADQSFTTSTWQKLNFDTVDFDLNSEFNTTTDEFEVNTTGYYRINASWRSTNTSTSTNAFGIAIVVNGVFEGAVNFDNSGSGYVFRSINRILDLNAGDSVEIQILNTGPIDVFSNDIVTSFEIEQIR